MIDKNIFLYWEGPKHSYLDLCIETVYRHNPDFNIYLLDQETIYNFLPELKDNENFLKLSKNFKSDYIRSRLLYRYGGIYLDVDIIVFKPLKKYLEIAEQYGAVIIGVDGTGCIISKAKSETIGLWAQEQDRVISEVEKVEEIGYSVLGYETIKPFSDNIKYIDDYYFIHWGSHELFFAENDFDPEVEFRKYSLCHLYNSCMARIFIQLSNEEILNSDMTISLMFRHALGVDKKPLPVKIDKFKISQNKSAYHDQKVYVLISTYKRYWRLKQILLQLERQTYRNVHILVCADGHDRLTELIVGWFKRRCDLPVDYDYLPEHGGFWGHPIKRYLLDKIADESAWAVFVDDDNRIYPEYIETLVKGIKPDRDIVYAQIKMGERDDWLIPPHDLNNSFVRGLIDTLCFMVRVKLAKRCKYGWMDRHGGDCDFITECGKFSNSSFVQSIIGEHP